MEFTVHISQVQGWGARLRDTAEGVATSARDLPDLAASPPGWATAAALAACEVAVRETLAALGEQAERTGAAVSACAVNYAAADREVRP